MATVTLTARYLDQLKSHGKRYEVFDAIVPGLAIRMSAAGRKTFTLYYRHRGRMRRVGLGRYPDVLLEKARKIATQHRGRIFDGADPASEKQTEHAQDDNTVQALYELYRSRKEKVLRSWSEVRRILEKEVLPAWRHRRVADIRRRDVRELVEQKAQTAPIQGNRVLDRISALFTFAVDQDWIEANPAWRIKKPGHERSRDRVLTRDELRELWPALHETEAKNADGTREAAALAGTERCLPRDAADGTALRGGVPNAVAGGRPGHWLVVDSRRRLEEPRPAPGPAHLDGP